MGHRFAIPIQSGSLEVEDTGRARVSARLNIEDIILIERYGGEVIDITVKVSPVPYSLNFEEPHYPTQTESFRIPLED